MSSDLVELYCLDSNTGAWMFTVQKHGQTVIPCHQQQLPIALVTLKFKWTVTLLVCPLVPLLMT